MLKVRYLTAGALLWAALPGDAAAVSMTEKRRGGSRARRRNISGLVQQFVAPQAKTGANRPQTEEDGIDG